ncbi:MAG TPA: hypothetical protein VGM76_11680 [Lacipirellulaceae bacterium]|jgi:beta-xylosidase
MRCDPSILCRFENVRLVCRLVVLVGIALAIERAEAEPGETGGSDARRASNDEFAGDALGPAWEWRGKPQAEWFSLAERPGWLRLNRVALHEGGSLWNAQNLLLRKFPRAAFTATMKMDVSGLGKPQRAGLVVFGVEYAALGVYRDGAGHRQLELGVCHGADRDKPEWLVRQIDFESDLLWLRVEVSGSGDCHFSYSSDGSRFTALGESFHAPVDPKVGLFCTAAAESGAAGHADFEFFRVE